MVSLYFHIQVLLSLMFISHTTILIRSPWQHKLCFINISNLFLSIDKKGVCISLRIHQFLPCVRFHVLCQSTFASVISTCKKKKKKNKKTQQSKAASFSHACTVLVDSAPGSTPVRRSSTPYVFSYWDPDGWSNKCSLEPAIVMAEGRSAMEDICNIF